MNSKTEHSVSVRNIRFSFSLQIGLFFLITTIAIITLIITIAIPQVTRQVEQERKLFMRMFVVPWEDKIKQYMADYSTSYKKTFQYKTYRQIHTNPMYHTLLAEANLMFNDLVKTEDTVHAVALFDYKGRFYGKNQKTPEAFYSYLVNRYEGFRIYHGTYIKRILTNYLPETIEIKTNINFSDTAELRRTPAATTTFYNYVYPIYRQGAPVYDGGPTNSRCEFGLLLHLFDRHRNKGDFFKATAATNTLHILTNNQIHNKSRATLRKLRRAYIRGDALALDAYAYSNAVFTADIQYLISSHILDDEETLLLIAIHDALDSKVFIKSGWEKMYSNRWMLRHELAGEHALTAEMPFLKRIARRYQPDEIDRIFRQHFCYHMLGVVFVQYFENKALKETRMLKSNMVGIAFGIGGRLLFIALFFIAHSLFSSVTQLSRNFTEFGKNPKAYHGTVTIHGANEFGMMADRFNLMTKDIQEMFRMAEELKSASDIQASLLPAELPSWKGWEFGAVYTAQTEAGGDYYDFFKIGKQHFGFVIADVSGHGVGSAMIMAVTRSFLRAFAPGKGSPAAIMKQINPHIFSDTGGSKYITMLYGIIHCDTASCTYASAGHNPTILYRAANKKLSELPPGGIPIGATDTETFDAVVTNRRVTLLKGDFIIQYTDGVTEAKNNDNEEFGEERLMETIRAHAHEPMQTIVERINAAVTKWSQGTPQSDDITLIAIQYTG